ncbi:hypothetical protein ACFLRB_04885, partial [Acidobacteriota bacterium]
MSTNKIKKLIPYVMMFFLAFILCPAPAAYGHPAFAAAVSPNMEDHFNAALIDYQKGNFQAASEKLAALRGMVE